MEDGGYVRRRKSRKFGKRLQDTLELHPNWFQSNGYKSRRIDVCIPC